MLRTEIKDLQDGDEIVMPDLTSGKLVLFKVQIGNFLGKENQIVLTTEDEDCKPDDAERYNHIHVRKEDRQGALNVGKALWDSLEELNAAMIEKKYYMG